MKKITLFSAGGVALTILLVLFTAGAKSNTALPKSTVSETLVADTIAITPKPRKHPKQRKPQL